MRIHHSSLSTIGLAALAAAVAQLAACSKTAVDAPAPASAASAVGAAPAARPAAATTATTTAADHAIDGAAATAAGIAWRHAASDADVDAAFAAARAEAKPVFVYWGAKWCPPCNQVKATLFNRQDFIERSRAFVPVYVDGDRPGAQKIGARFNVSGYPTMLLFNPQGAELTRLPGEVDAERYTEVLTLGMNARRPVAEVLAAARAGGTRNLAPNDWKLLAFYSWDTDDQQLVAKGGTPALLKELADACPADQPQAATRLHLKALAALDGKAPAKPDVPLQAMLLKVLADEQAARSHLDVLTNHAADIARAASLKGTLQRARIVDAFNVAMRRIEADASVSRADRITALYARVDLAKIDAAPQAKTPPKLPDALLADVREHAARVDREITDGYERQAVVTAAAYTLQEAGLGAESDALLKANLAKSHSPYYLMSSLAGNARQRGDKAEALRWYEQAFDKSEGPSTRLQWGGSYLNALVDLAPQDEARIEKAARQLFSEAAAQSDAFYDRSGRSLKRIGTRLQDWNKDGAHAAALQRLQSQLDGVCSRLDAADPQRASCDALLKPAPKPTA